MTASKTVAVLGEQGPDREGTGRRPQGSLALRGHTGALTLHTPAHTPALARSARWALWGLSCWRASHLGVRLGSQGALRVSPRGSRDLHSIYLFFNIFTSLFLKRGEGKEKERNINVWLPLTHPPTGSLTWPGNLDMCPDWESNQTPFGLQAGAQSPEPHQPGQDLHFNYSHVPSHDIGATLSYLFSVPGREPAGQECSNRSLIN